MNDDRKRYLNKIRKLMNLANNTSSPAEAASAIAKAQAFMREHGYSESEVQFSDIGTSESKTAPSDADKLPRYMAMLISTIEKAMGVRCIISWRHTKGGYAKRVVKFYGLESRDVAAAYTFDVLTRLIKKARKEFQGTHCTRLSPARKKKAADKFCEGWVSGVYQAIKALVISDEQSSVMKAYEKSLIDDGAQASKLQSSTGSAKYHACLAKGFQEGSKVSLFHGVDGSGHSEETKLLAGGK